jgi:hypothetical protein
MTRDCPKKKTAVLAVSATSTTSPRMVDLEELEHDREDPGKAPA